MPDEAPPTACPASLIRHANSRWRVGLIVIAVIAAIAVVAGVISHATPNRNDVLQVVPDATLAPTLASQTVYVPTDDGVYALRASDGALRWTYPAGIDKAPGGRPSPCSAWRSTARRSTCWPPRRAPVRDGRR